VTRVGITIGSTVVRCFEFEKMVQCWQAALHYEPLQLVAAGWVILADPARRRPTLPRQGSVATHEEAGLDPA